MFYTLGGALPPFFVGAGQFSPVSGAVRGAAAGAQSAPARPPAQAGGWAGFAGAARKTAAARPRGSTYAGGSAYPKRQARPLRPSAFPCNQQPATDNPICVHPRWQLPPCTPEPYGGGGGRAKRARPPRPRASTCVGGGAYPKSHRVKLLPQKRKKVANRHFFAMRYP